MSLELPQHKQDAFSKTEGAELDKQPSTMTENNMDQKLCNQEESLSSVKTLNTSTSKSPTEERGEDNFELTSDQIKSLTAVETPVLNGYNIDEDVKRAIESGGIEQYCQDLVTKLTQRTHTELKSVFELVTKMKDQVFALVREENRLKEQNENEGKDPGKETFEAEFKLFPNAIKHLIEQARDSSDLEGFYDRVTTEIWKTVVAMRDQAIKDAQSIAKQVSEASKARVMRESEVNTRSSSDSQLNVKETNCEERDVDEDLLDSKFSGGLNKKHMDGNEENLATKDVKLKCESNITSSTTNKDHANMGTKDVDQAKTETKKNRSQMNENESNLGTKDLKKDPMNSESDEDNEKPPIRGHEDEHVIPTPPPPPPIKPMYRRKVHVDQTHDNITGFKPYQVNQLRKELNFAIARLTSEVIKSYEHACILKKHDLPSLEKSSLEFMEKQETKKTFFLKEICTRVQKALRMLSPEPAEMNAELQDLDETLKLLYILQTSKNYYVDTISVSTSSNTQVGVSFYFLLLLAFSVTGLSLSVNGEWFALILFVGIVLTCMIKSWQGMVCGKKKKVEVHGRKKKVVKID